MKMPYIRATTYGYDTNKASDDTGLACTDKSRTQQHMADECNINKLVERFVVTGEMPQLNMPPLQGDFTQAPTYQESLNLMIEARNSFMQLPAKIRSRFENDAGEFVQFASDPNNSEELRRMGLWSPEAVAAFELKAQTQKDLDELNRRDAEAYRASQKTAGKGDKGVT